MRGTKKEVSRVVHSAHLCVKREMLRVMSRLEERNLTWTLVLLDWQGLSVDCPWSTQPAGQCSQGLLLLLQICAAGSGHTGSTTDNLAEDTRYFCVTTYGPTECRQYVTHSGKAWWEKTVSLPWLAAQTAMPTKPSTHNTARARPYPTNLLWTMHRKRKRKKEREKRENSEYERNNTRGEQRRR